MSNSSPQPAAASEALLEIRDLWKAFPLASGLLELGSHSLTHPNFTQLAEAERERAARMAVVGNGKPAVTHYRVLERFRGHNHLSYLMSMGTADTDSVNALLSFYHSVR